MISLIDQITAGFLGAIAAGQQVLAVFAIPILAICALISWYREYSMTVMASGAGLGDALAHALTIVFAAGCYMFVLLQLFAIGQAALDTVFYWGLLGAGSGVSSAQLTAPSFIFEAGMKVAKPIADFDTWFRAVQSTVKLAAHPGDLLAYWAIVLSFAGITLHTMMMLIEFHLSLMFASVLIPWGIWRLTSGVAEFGLGWLMGCLVRALVSSAMVGIATPLFGLLNQPVPSTGFFTLPQTFVLLVGSLVYLVLCLVVPAMAARLAGQASLGLTGSTLTSAAMGVARIGIIANSLSLAASRAVSPMLRRG